MRTTMICNEIQCINVVNNCIYNLQKGKNLYGEMEMYLGEIISMIGDVYFPERKSNKHNVNLILKNQEWRESLHTNLLSRTADILQICWISFSRFNVSVAFGSCISTYMMNIARECKTIMLWSVAKVSIHIMICLPSVSWLKQIQRKLYTHQALFWFCHIF